MRRAFILSLLLAIQANAQSWIKMIARTNNVLTLEDRTKGAVSWFQGQTVVLKNWATLGSTAISLPTNGFPILYVTDRSLTNYYILTTGSFANAAGGVTAWTLAPELTALPEGTYEAVAAVYESNPTGQPPMVVVDRYQAKVQWSANYAGTLRDPMTLAVGDDVARAWAVGASNAAIAARAVADAAYPAANPSNFISLADVGTGSVDVVARASVAIAMNWATNAKSGVWLVSTNGSCVHWKSNIRGAVLAAGSGDSVVIHSGTYEVSPDIISTNSDYPASLAAIPIEGKDGFTLTGMGNPTIKSVTMGDIVAIKNSRHIEISGITFSGTGSNARVFANLNSLITMVGSNEHLRIHHNTFANFPNHAVSAVSPPAKFSRQVIVSDNIFTNGGSLNMGAGPTDYAADGAAVSGVNSGWIVTRNIIRDCARGIEIEGAQPGNSNAQIILSDNILQNIWELGIMCFLDSETNIPDRHLTMRDIVISGNIYSNRPPTAPYYLTTIGGINVSGGQNISLLNNKVEINASGNVTTTGDLIAVSCYSGNGKLVGLRIEGNEISTDTQKCSAVVIGAEQYQTDQVVFRNNIINMPDPFGVALRMYGGNAVIDGNIFNTHASASWETIYMKSHAVQSNKNLIVANNVLRGGGGITVAGWTNVSGWNNSCDVAAPFTATGGTAGYGVGIVSQGNHRLYGGALAGNGSGVTNAQDNLGRSWAQAGSNLAAAAAVTSGAAHAMALQAVSAWRPLEIAEPSTVVPAQTIDGITIAPATISDVYPAVFRGPAITQSVGATGLEMRVVMAVHTNDLTIPWWGFTPGDGATLAQGTGQTWYVKEITLPASYIYASKLTNSVTGWEIYKPETSTATAYILKTEYRELR